MDLILIINIGMFTSLIFSLFFVVGDVSANNQFLAGLIKIVAFVGVLTPLAFWYTHYLV